jgi:aspartate aminotransferase
VEPRLFDRTLTCNSVAKAYVHDGLAHRFRGRPTAIIKAMATHQSKSTTNPSSISQAAVIGALEGPLDFLAERNTVFQMQRDLCLGFAQSMG